MSEYNFEYNCISMKNDKDEKNDKALQFMVYQDYKDNGNVVIQVYIPNEIRKNVSFVKLFFTDHAVDFPKLTGDKDQDRAIWSKALTFNSLKSGKLSTLNEENCIYIKPKEQLVNESKKRNQKLYNGCLSGTGLIGLILKDDPEGENGVPSVENVYKFVTNFAKKESISYQIIEHKNSIVVEVTYPKLSKDINLNVLAAHGHKPLMNKDKIEENYLLDNSGKRYVIKLKATKRVNDSTRVTIHTMKSSTHDFRLVFEDEFNNNLYRLCDESTSTLEDAKVSRKRKEIKIGKGKVHRCPYCGGIIKEYNGKEKNGVFTCDGKRIGDPISKDRKKIIVCGNESSMFGLSNGEYLVLPEHYMDKPVLNIVLAGKRHSGKTIMISSLINMEKEAGDETIYKASPFVLNSIVKHFDKNSGKKNLSCEEIKVETLKSSLNNKFTFVTKYQDFRKVNELDSRYVISVGEQIERQTTLDLAKTLSYNPVGFDLNKLGYMYFYDVPGECFNDNATAKVRAFDIANGIIAIIDGNNDQQEDPFNKFVEALNKISKLTNDSKNVYSIPIAVVFSKLDLKLPMFFNKEKDFAKYNECFDENCHLVRENLLDLFPSSRKYHNSELEKHIDCSSYEIEHYLKSLKKENSDQIAKIKEKYRNIKFFACSALGSDNCLQASDKTVKAEILFKPRRLRLELPIIWLMYKNGLIRK